MPGLNIPTPVGATTTDLWDIGLFFLGLVVVSAGVVAGTWIKHPENRHPTAPGFPRASLFTFLIATTGSLFFVLLGGTIWAVANLVAMGATGWWSVGVVALICAWGIGLYIVFTLVMWSQLTKDYPPLGRGQPVVTGKRVTVQVVDTKSHRTWKTYQVLNRLTDYTYRVVLLGLVLLLIVPMCVGALVRPIAHRIIRSQSPDQEKH